ncbi:MAG: biotin synthase [Candidatus Thermoplasmatota archaeon]|nr:biotin synthase [Candidatus Thermoplasmatota archaeon]MBU1941196.1 biotin synthase [Candidatus Thermoplasmatota archaeon]
MPTIINMQSSKDIIIKAHLLSEGTIYLPPNIHLPFPVCRSTAGPGAGAKMLTLTFRHHTVKLQISPDQNTPLWLDHTADGYQLLRNGSPILNSLIPVYVPFHAPNQLFLNIEPKCIHNCRFCTQNYLPPHITTTGSHKKITHMLLQGLQTPQIHAVAFTAGIYPNTQEITHKMVALTQLVKHHHPTTPVGVETYINSDTELHHLQKSGVDEIKINLQLPTSELFSQFCPTLDYEFIKTMLQKAVTHFGKGKVCSNIIYGLGERNEELYDAITELAEMGVVTTLRKLTITPNNIQRISEITKKPLKSPDAQRIITLAQRHKTILSHYNLTPKTFSTMCHRCGCCDIIPFVDF